MAFSIAIARATGNTTFSSTAALNVEEKMTAGDVVAMSLATSDSQQTAIQTATEATITATAGETGREFVERFVAELDAIPTIRCRASQQGTGLFHIFAEPVGRTEDNANGIPSVVWFATASGASVTPAP